MKNDNKTYAVLASNKYAYGEPMNGRVTYWVDKDTAIRIFKDYENNVNYFDVYLIERVEF
jgi:hypothetical protein